MAPHLSSGDATTWAFIQRLTDLASDVVDREVRAVADISGSDLDVLQLLVDSPTGILQQGEISQALGWDKSRLSHQITRMEHRGFVERVKSGRTHAVVVTREGLQRHDLAVSAHAHAVREVLTTHLSPEERAALRETALAVADLEESDATSGDAASTDAAPAGPAPAAQPLAQEAADAIAATAADTEPGQARPLRIRTV